MKSRFSVYYSVLLSIFFIAFYRPMILGVRSNSFFNNLENSWQDSLFKIHAQNLKTGDSRIIIVAMDDQTIHKYGYPLPRLVFAKLLDKLKTDGVKTTAFDIFFFERRAGDTDLVAATRRFKKTIHTYSFESILNPNGTWSYHLSLPILGLIQASQHLGYADIGDVISRDGHVRRFKLFEQRTLDPRGKHIAASLATAAYSSFAGVSFDALIQRYATPFPQTFFLNFRPLHYFSQSNANTHPLFSSAHQTFSIVDILNDRLTPEQKGTLKGSLVLIGSTALGAYDHYPTPFQSSSPGVEFHANIIDNLLHGDWLHPFSPMFTLFMILLMIWAPFFFKRFVPSVSVILAFFLISFWCAFANYEFLKGFRIEFVAPTLALLASFLGQTIYRMMTEGREKKFIKNLFTQFVSPEIVDDLAKNPSKIKLGGEKRDMTVLFLDIAHFTTISEKMTPEALISFLNRYLSTLSQVIHEHEGVVDKYIGDCIMAFWNAPIEVKDHRKQACFAAIAAQEAMARLNRDLDSLVPEPPTIRIGINSGKMTVGLTGSEKKLQYTVIGDEVNLASRLEGANKFFGSRIIISEATYLSAKSAIEARELGLVQVLGKAAPVKVYEIIGRKEALSQDWKKALPLYEKALQKFHLRHYSEAAELFEQFLKIFPQDGPVAFYLAASRDYIAIPPDPSWDGVIKLTAK